FEAKEFALPEDIVTPDLPKDELIVVQILDNGIRIQPIGHQAEILEEILRCELEPVPDLDAGDIDRQPRCW
ncbi:hypothetical protein ACC699_40570, partial [Rhizobium ruizarguesonis]